MQRKWQRHLGKEDSAKTDAADTGGAADSQQL